MKKTILFILILLGLQLSATPELDSYSYNSPNLKLEIIYRYDNPLDRALYKAMAASLDSYIDSLKHKGYLQRGQLHFEIMTAQWMDSTKGVEMYRYPNGYYCYLNGLKQEISLSYLQSIVLYFGSEQWSSFCYDELKLKPSLALQLFNQNLLPVDSMPQTSAYNLEQIGALRLYFKEDALYASLSNEEIGKLHYLLPFEAQGLIFISQADGIKVYKEGRLLQEMTWKPEGLAKPNHEALRVELFPKWINIASRDVYLFSYSIEDNRFYKL